MSLSTFGERFQFSRIVQSLRGITETDGEFADAVGVGGSSVTAYKTADEAPPASRTLIIARRCGVDPGWLTFGEDSHAPVPQGFEAWLEKRRSVLAGNPVNPERLAREVHPGRDRGGRDLPTTGPAALAHAVRRTADQSELERKDIPTKRPKRKGA